MSRASNSPLTIKPALDWIRSRGWKAFLFQRQAWKAYLNGHDLLIHSATGSGKTLAAWMGPVLESLYFDQRRRPLSAIWITPLKALAADTTQSLQEVMEQMGSPWRLESRTGDTCSSVRKKQLHRLPHALVTTPESLTILQTYSEMQDALAGLKVVIVDEWHELLGTKRGVLLELALASLRAAAPSLQTIGLSATLGNLEQAFEVLLGRQSQRPRKIITGVSRKKLVIQSAFPDSIERFPWAGHLGTRLVAKASARIDQAKSSLVFTNTRNQTELWYQALLRARTDYAGQIALHHGSLDASVRKWVEQSLREERLKAVVCTSSLDLGVDFTAVEEVIQVGSPKGIARLLQRAGRSGHQPRGTSRLLLVPTNVLELMELSAARNMMRRGILEVRQPERTPLDLLCQHLVSRGIAQPYQRSQILEELRSTYAFSDLSESQLEWCIQFAKQGGCLSRYEDFQRLEEDDQGHLRVTSSKVIKRHRASIGTIVSDASIPVRYLKGGNIGTVEESFISRLNAGDRFLFAGRTLEFIKLHNSVAWVRRSKGAPNAVPRWMGGRIPLSSQLSQGIRERIEEASLDHFADKEMQAVRPVLELQKKWSHLPAQDEFLIEQLRTREGYHLFFYPFDGRLVHEGLAAVIAHRLSRHRKLTFSLAANDYGFLLHSAKDPMLTRKEVCDSLRIEDLLDDAMASLNSSEMAKRQFREIARIAGLIWFGYPGEQRSNRHLQASSDLIYDVFAKYDPENLLLVQAKREVLNRQLQWERLRNTMERINASNIVWQTPERPTPFGFALMVERIRERVSSESLAERVLAMQQRLEKAADSPEIEKTKE